MNTILETSVVSSSPEVMSGAAVFTGTRVPPQSLLDYLADGHSLGEFLDDFPTVTRELAVSLLKEVSQTLEWAGVNASRANSTTATRSNRITKQKCLSKRSFR